MSGQKHDIRETPNWLSPALKVTIDFNGSCLSRIPAISYQSCSTSESAIDDTDQSGEEPWACHDFFSAMHLRTVHVESSPKETPVVHISMFAHGFEMGTGGRQCELDPAVLPRGGSPKRARTLSSIVGRFNVPDTPTNFAFTERPCPGTLEALGTSLTGMIVPAHEGEYLIPNNVVIEWISPG